MFVTLSSVEKQGYTIEEAKIIKETHENQKHFFVLQVVYIHPAFDFRTRPKLERLKLNLFDYMTEN
jgi:hypothetical protein